MRKWRSFIEARKYARSFGLKSCGEWHSFCKLVGKPDDIPRNPDREYKDDGWLGYSDWVGNNRFNGKSRLFEEARNFIRSLGLKNSDEWHKYAKSGYKPDDIPSCPNTVYKGKGWINMGDWLGTGRIATKYRVYRAFEEARDYVRELGLRDQKEWKEFAKSGDKPVDIPSVPWVIYMGWGWVGMKDWLGTIGVILRSKRFIPFEEARDYVRELGLRGQEEWGEFAKSGDKPVDIPSAPWNVYSDSGWIGLKDWLGTAGVIFRSKKFLPFEEARDYVRELGLRGQEEWVEFAKSGDKPIDIPTSPDKVYKSWGWINMGVWLGSGYVATRDRVYRPFEAAREFVRSLCFKNQPAWYKYCTSGAKPNDIPRSCNVVYEEWVDWGDWLGTGTIATQNRVYRPFEEARNFVRMLKLNAWEEWQEYMKSDEIPVDIPHGPHQVYKDNGWVNWADWLGYEERKSRGERIIIDLITNVFPNEDMRTQYGSGDHGFRYKKTGGNMPFDVAIPKLNLFFEYQGKQHYDMISFFGGIRGFFERKERDREKRLACKENGIILIEIPYTWDGTEKYLRNSIREAGVPIPCSDFTS